MSIFNDPAQYKRLTSSSADHVRRYRASEGQDGHINANGLRHLLLTTVGRKSGMERTTPLIYGREGERFIIVGSVGGADQHPRWFVNLVEHPEVHVQVGPERFAAMAHQATDEEKPRLWRLMAEIFPPYDEYQGRTRRVIPVVILERA